MHEKHNKLRVKMSFLDESEMYPILMEYFDSRGYDTLSQASFKIIKNWHIDVVAYDDQKKELVAVEAKLNLEDALHAISQAEMYQMACSKVYVAFPQTEWELRTNRSMRRDVEEICKKRGIGILKVKGRGLTKPCEEVLRPALSVKIDLAESILKEIKTKKIESFEGFDRDDFSYFLDNSSWKKEKIRMKFVKLIEEIEKLKSVRAPFLKDHKIRMQTLGKGYAGLNIFKGTKHTKVTHYSIGIGADFFSVFIQIPSNRLVRSFLKELRSNKEKFLSLISKISECDIELYSRTSRAKHGRPMPGGTIYNKVLDVKASEITPEFLDELIKLVDRTRYPAINFSMDYDLESSGYIIKKDAALNFIFDVLNHLRPLYGFIPITT